MKKILASFAFLFCFAQFSIAQFTFDTNKYNINDGGTVKCQYYDPATGLLYMGGDFKSIEYPCGPALEMNYTVKNGSARVSKRPFDSAKPLVHRSEGNHYIADVVAETNTSGVVTAYYVAGRFSAALNAADGKYYPRNNIAKFLVSNGVISGLDLSWAALSSMPIFGTNFIKKLLLDTDNNVLFFAGNFRFTQDNVLVRGVAAINTGNGSLATSVMANSGLSERDGTYEVNDMLFATIGGKKNLVIGGFCAMNTTQGQGVFAYEYNASANPKYSYNSNFSLTYSISTSINYGWVNSLALDGTKLHIGGQAIDKMLGQDIKNYAIYDLATGRLTTPNLYVDNAVTKILIYEPGKALVGGSFTQVNGQIQKGLFRMFGNNLVTESPKLATYENITAMGLMPKNGSRQDVWISGSLHTAANGQKQNDVGRDFSFGLISNIQNGLGNPMPFNQQDGSWRLQAANDYSFNRESGEACQFNSHVSNVVFSGNTMIIAGYFNSRSYYRSNVAAVNAATGALQPMEENTDGPVLCINKIGNTVIAGGEFRSVNGFAANYISYLLEWRTDGPNAYKGGIHAGSREGGVAIDLDPLTGYRNFNGAVRKIEVVGQDVFLAGDFTRYEKFHTITLTKSIIESPYFARLSSKGNLNLNLERHDMANTLGVNGIAITPDAIYLTGNIKVVGSPARGFLKFKLDGTNQSNSQNNSPFGPQHDKTIIPFGLKKSPDNSFLLVWGCKNDGTFKSDIKFYVFSPARHLFFTNSIFSNAAPLDVLFTSNTEATVGLANDGGIAKVRVTDINTALVGTAQKITGANGVYSIIAIQALNKVQFGGNINLLTGLNGLRLKGILSSTQTVDFTTAPTTAPSNLRFSNVTPTSVTLKWDKGNGQKTLLLVKFNSTPENVPNGYDPKVKIFNGQDVTAMLKGKYKDPFSFIYEVELTTENEYTFTGLAVDYTAYFTIVEYNGSAANTKYGTALRGNKAPTKPNPVQNLAASSTHNSITLNWINGNGTERWIWAKKGSPISFTPTDLTRLDRTAEADGIIGTSAYELYAITKGNSITIPNLDHTTNYSFVVADAYLFDIWTVKYAPTFDYFRGNSGQEFNYFFSMPNAITFSTKSPPPLPPTATATNLTVTPVDPNTVNVSWTLQSGCGSKRLLLVAEGDFSGLPLSFDGNVSNHSHIEPHILRNNKTFIANQNASAYRNVSVFLSIPIGREGAFPLPSLVVFNGAGTTATVSGLSANTAYTYVLVEYNGTAGNESYLFTPLAKVASQTPALLRAPGVDNEVLTSFTGRKEARFYLKEKEPNSKVLLIMRQDQQVTFVPTNYINYTANSAFGAGTDLGSGQYVVFNGNSNTNNFVVTGLNPNSTYYYQLYSYNSSGSTVVYKTPPQSTATLGVVSTKPPSWPQPGSSNSEGLAVLTEPGTECVYMAGKTEYTFLGLLSPHFGIMPTGNITSNFKKVFVSKYDKEGNVRWAVSAISSNDKSEANGLARDASGNIYICGTFSGTLGFAASPNPITLTANGSEDVFIAKLDSTGAVLWAHRTGGASFPARPNYSGGITIDDTGNPVLAGSFVGTTTFDNSSTTLSVNGSSANADILVAKYNAGTGALMWAQKGGGLGSDFANGIASSSAGIFVVGNIRADDNTQVASFGTQTTTMKGYRDVALIKYNTSGAAQWVKTYGGQFTTDIATRTDHNGRGVVCGPSDNAVFICGNFNNTINFSGAVNLTSNGMNDGFVASVSDNDGSLNWARKIGSASEEDMKAISWNSGTVYVTGLYSGAVSGFNYLLPSDASNGASVAASWNGSSGNPGTGNPLYIGVGNIITKAISCLSASKVFVTGQYNGTPCIGTTNLVSPERTSFLQNIVAPVPPDISSDLIAHFKLNNNFNDASGNNFNGTGSGSPVSVADRWGELNKAYKFNAGTSFSFGIGSPVADRLTEFSISFWFKEPPAQGTANICNLSAFGMPVGGVFFENARLKMSLNVPLLGININGECKADLPVNDGKWHHCAYSYKAGTFPQFYIDGVNQTPAPAAGATAPRTAFQPKLLTYTVGASGADSKSISLDDMRLYKTALTDMQILAIKEATSDNSAPPQGGSVSGNVLQHVWPNPTTGVVSFELMASQNEQPVYRVYDLSGKLIFEQKEESIAATGSFVKTLDLSALSNGYYLLKVENNGTLSTTKIVLSK